MGLRAVDPQAVSTPEDEAQGALVALGYKPSEVAKMLKGLDTAKMATEELIREALRRVHAAGSKA
jgi:Holliday junction DNA helicase RuvA